MFTRWVEEKSARKTDPAIKGQSLPRMKMLPKNDRFQAQKSSKIMKKKLIKRC